MHTPTQAPRNAGPSTQTKRDAPFLIGAVDIHDYQSTGFKRFNTLQAWRDSLTDSQRRERAAFEAAMAADRLRRLPTCFGDLA